MTFIHKSLYAQCTKLFMHFAQTPSPYAQCTNPFVHNVQIPYAPIPSPSPLSNPLHNRPQCPTMPLKPHTLIIIPLNPLAPFSPFKQCFRNYEFQSHFTYPLTYYQIDVIIKAQKGVSLCFCILIFTAI